MKNCVRQSGFGAVVGILLLALMALASATINAQSKPQKTERPAGEGKKNSRPVPLSPEEQKKAAEEKKAAEKAAEEEKNAIVDPTIEKLETKIVNVDAVVFNKKTGQVVQGLKR